MKSRRFVSAFVLLFSLFVSGHSEATTHPYDVTAVRVIVEGQSVSLSPAPGEANFYKVDAQTQSGWPSHVTIEVDWQWTAPEKVWTGQGYVDDLKCNLGTATMDLTPADAFASVLSKDDGVTKTGIFKEVDRKREITVSMRCENYLETLYGKKARIRLAMTVDLEWDPFGPDIYDHPYASWCEENVIAPEDGSMLGTGEVTVNGEGYFVGKNIFFHVERAKEWHIGVYKDLALPEGMVYVTEWELVAQPMFTVNPGMNTIVWDATPPSGYYRVFVGLIVLPCPWRYFWIRGPKDLKVPLQAVSSESPPPTGDSSRAGTSSKREFGSAARAIRGERRPFSNPGGGEDGEGAVPADGGMPRVGGSYREGTLSPGSRGAAGTPLSGPGVTRSGLITGKLTTFYAATDLSVNRLSLNPSPLKPGNKARLEIDFKNGGKKEVGSDSRYGVSCTVVSGDGECPVPTGIFPLGETIPPGETVKVTLSAGNPADPGEYRVEVTVPPNAVKKSKAMVIEVAPGARKVLKKAPVLEGTAPKIERKIVPPTHPQLQSR